MIKLKNILLEDSPEKVFGKAAFAYPKKIDDDEGLDSLYSDIRKLQGITIKEPNTATEEHIFTALLRWIDGDTTGVSMQLFKRFELFKQAKKRYPKIFGTNLPNGTPCYRALNLMPSFVKKNGINDKLKNKEYKEQIFGDHTFYVLDEDIKYTPHNPVQSWTVDKHVTRGFIDTYNTLYLQAIFISEINNNEFLFNPDFFNCIADVNEYEILHFGKSYSKKIKLAIAKQPNLVTNK